jgi:transglutaminase-like putative cysteine protease
MSANREVDMDAYLRRTAILDWDHPSVTKLAADLRSVSSDDVDLARRSFEWVRDEIRHSSDFHMNPVTSKASDVLIHRTGFCYAKSHLLASLLRANGIAAGLCYQRLAVDEFGPPFCIHGFNAVLLPGWGWYRVDPRGNKEGVNAQFRPPVEQLAFAPRQPGEADLAEIWSDPLPCVIESLEAHTTWDGVLRNLPDVPLAGG